MSPIPSILLGAELHDAGEHRNGAMRCEACRVDADLAHPRQTALEQLHHLRQIVAGRRLAAGNVEVFDGAPEIVCHHAVELVERHVRFAIAHLPVAAHFAARVAHERAVIDEHGRTNGLEARHHPRVGKISWDACCGFGQVVEPEGVGRHEVGLW